MVTIGRRCGRLQHQQKRGVLTFRSSPDYEEPADADTNNTYMVTVRADDGTYMDTVNVTIRVTDEDEAGPGGSLLDRYDTDGDNQISKDEALAAVEDYLVHRTITKDMALEVIFLYLIG